MIGAERRPHLTNDVPHDSRVSDLEWAAREGMVAFAVIPLIVEDRLVGVLALFARHALGDDTIRALASVATGIGIGIERKRAEAALRLSEAQHRFCRIHATDGVDGHAGRCARLCGQQAESYFGVKSEDLMGSGWLTGVHPDDPRRPR